jgi:hypothetical protein
LVFSVKFFSGFLGFLVFLLTPIYDFGEQWATPTTETSGYHASSSHLWAALADSSLANGFPTIEEYFSTNREEADSGPASCIGRDGVLYLEETRALAGPGKNN